MPIKLQRIDGLSCPIVICDVCRQRIVKATDGNYIWRQEQEAQGADILFVHKTCDDKANLNLRGFGMSAELRTFPIFVGNNLDLDWDDANRHASLMSRF